ncbi:MAG: flagellar biosynthetic protein FliR [Anaerolineae bacterium]|nr:flagellar biosynthetic protein FliR [Anaerolineae bacterium]
MSFQIPGAWLEQALLTFIRVLAVFSTGPVFSYRGVAAPIKVGLALVLTYLVLAPGGQPVSPAPDGLTFLMAVGGEVIIGLLLGFASMLAFHALEMAGGIVGAEMGLSFPSSINPSLPDQGSMIQQFYFLFATLIFLAINGHYAFLLALRRTLDVVPPGSFVVSGLMSERLIRLSAAIFWSAVQIALPVLATLILTDIGLALISRVMPRIPVFILGMPLKVGVGLIAMALTWPLMLPVIRWVLDRAASNMLLVIR